MRIPTPNYLRKEVLRLDMHEVPAAEIARQTGVKRVTVAAILARTRGARESAHRGNVMLLYDPAGILSSGARFNLPDLEWMVELSGLMDGTLFEVARRDGSRYRAEMRSGELIKIGIGGVQ